MTSLRCLIAVAALAFTVPAQVAVPAQAGVNDPEVLIYRGAGVIDNGGMGLTGNATAFHCTNFSGVPENIRFVVRTATGTLAANSAAAAVAHLNTVTALTKDTVLFFIGIRLMLNTGSVPAGTVAIAATSINVTCTAMLVDATTMTPAGIKLHLTRFNPIPATEE